MTTAPGTGPRVYVAATRQNDGKTTACIGLMSVLRSRFPRLGFIKPVGQRYVEVEGHRIDADAVLMRDVYGCPNALSDMSPIAVDRSFTRRYIDRPNPQELERLISDCFARVAVEKDIVVIEGTGHAGVGSVFDMNNARVAALLKAPTILVSCGGIGRPFDEITLNRAVFEKHGVRLIGVIVNKVQENKRAEITAYLSRALERAGLPLLGVIPHRPPLLCPTIRQVLDTLQADVLNGEENLHQPLKSIVIGAMTPHQALNYFTADSLIVTPGDRDDLVLTAISLASTSQTRAKRSVAGLVLTGGIRPRRNILQVIQRTNIPVLLSPDDTYRVASQLHDMMVKIKPEEENKIHLIQHMFEKYFDVNKFMEQLA